MVEHPPEKRKPLLKRVLGAVLVGMSAGR